MEQAFNSPDASGVDSKLHPLIQFRGEQKHTRPIMYKLVCTALVALAAVGCGGSGGGGGPAALELQVSYQTPFAVYYQGVSIASNTPTLLGTAESFSVSPALPPGLELDATTGIISGQPQGTAPERRYTITSMGQGAVATTNVNIGIVLPPRFVFVANQQDSTISSFAINLDTGQLQHDGYVSASADAAGPAELLMHPSGEFFFAVNRNSNSLAVYGLDSQTGIVTQLSTVGEGLSPNEMVLSPSGRFLYVAHLFTPDSTLRTYEFDDTTGTLTAIGTPIITTPVSADLAMHPTGRFISLTNRFNGIIQTFAIDPLTGIPSLATTAPVNSLTSGITFSSDGLYAYVTAENFNLLVRFRVDTMTGEFSDPRTKPTDDAPKFVRLHPSGRFVYVVNKGSNTITKYLINPDNGTPQFPTIVPTGFSPHSIAFDPGGNFAYVMNADSASLSVYRVDLETGNLLTEEGMRARTKPRSMVMVQGQTPVTNKAQFVYVVNEESGDVGSYTANPVTNTLEMIGLAPLAGDSPVAVVADPLGRFVYVANSGSNDISCFALNDITGSLTEIGPRIANGAGTNGLAIEPSGRFLYAIAKDSANVTAYRVDEATGDLAFVQMQPTTNPNPVSVAVDPTGRFLYVVNSGIEADPDSNGGVDVFAIDNRFGTLTPEADSGVDGGSPTTITFGRSGSTAYVPLNSTPGIVTAEVDAETGSLDGEPQDVNSLLRTLAIDVAPEGKFAYSAVLDAASGVHQIDTLGIAANGNLSLITTTSDNASAVDLQVDPSGQFLYTVNADTDDISLFAIETDGSLTFVSRTSAGLAPAAIAIVGTLK